MVFGSIVSLLNGALKAFNEWRGAKNRKESRKDGANEEKLKQYEEVQDAKDRMGDVERPGRDAAVERLRDKGL